MPATAGERRTDAVVKGYFSWDPKERGEAKRPFRLWDATKRKNVPSRNYAESRRAHNAALIEIRWAKVDHSLEVYDVRTHKLLGTYTRKVNSVLFQAA